MKKTRKRVLWFIFILFLLFLARKYCIQPLFVLGKSMEPTLQDRRIVLVNKAIYYFKLPERGDIIVFRTTEKPPLYFTKRIVGLPGEIIEIRKGRVFINGHYFPESYITINKFWDLKRTKIKENCFYVLGDNRLTDLSFHLHGQVALRNIVGRVILRQPLK